jgi:hypothetical protein
MLNVVLYKGLNILFEEPTCAGVCGSVLWIVTGAGQSFRAAPLRRQLGLMNIYVILTATWRRNDCDAVMAMEVWRGAKQEITDSTEQFFSRR